MENLNPQTLEQALPADPLEQNVILKKVVVMLQNKLNLTKTQLQNTKDQLCTACTHQDGFAAPANSNTVTEKERVAAVAKAASMQADYDSLVAQFQEVKNKHVRILNDLDHFKDENNVLRTRAADLSRQLHAQKLETSRFQELQILCSNTQMENQRLGEQQASAYAVTAELQDKLQKIQFQNQKTVLDLQNKLQLADMKCLQLEKLQAENGRLRAEMQQMYELTSCHSVLELSHQIDELKKVKAALETESDDLRHKLADERTTAIAKLEIEKKRIAETERQLSEQQRSQLKTQYDNLMNQQILQHQSQEQALMQKIKNLEIELQKTLTELQTANTQRDDAQRQLKDHITAFNSAKERAKQRNIQLGNQLQEIIMQKDVLESRMEQLQALAQQKDRDIVELKALNRQFQRQSESVFMQLKDTQPDLKPQTDETTLPTMPARGRMFELKNSTVGLTASGIETALDIIRDENDLEAQDACTLTIEITCHGGLYQDKCSLSIDLLGESLQSQQFSTTNDGEIVFEQNLIIPWDARTKQAFEEGVKITLYSSEGQELDQQGFQAGQLIRTNEIRQEITISDIILEISLQVQPK